MKLSAPMTSAPRSLPSWENLKGRQILEYCDNNYESTVQLDGYLTEHAEQTAPEIEKELKHSMDSCKKYAWVGPLAGLTLGAATAMLAGGSAWAAVFSGWGGLSFGALTQMSEYFNREDLLQQFKEVGQILGAQDSNQANPNLRESQVDGYLLAS